MVTLGVRRGGFWVRFGVGVRGLGVLGFRVRGGVGVLRLRVFVGVGVFFFARAIVFLGRGVFGLGVVRITRRVFAGVTGGGVRARSFTLTLGRTGRLIFAMG